MVDPRDMSADELCEVLTSLGDGRYVDECVDRLRDVRTLEGQLIWNAWTAVMVLAVVDQVARDERDWQCAHGGHVPPASDTGK